MARIILDSVVCLRRRAFAMGAMISSNPRFHLWLRLANREGEAGLMNFDRWISCNFCCAPRKTAEKRRLPHRDAQQFLHETAPFSSGQPRPSRRDAPAAATGCADATCVDSSLRSTCFVAERSSPHLR